MKVEVGHLHRVLIEVGAPLLSVRASFSARQRDLFFVDVISLSICTVLASA